MKNKFKNILIWLAAPIWMVVIFGLSAMPGSGEDSFGWFYFVERKVFHVLEYFMLSVLTYFIFLQKFSQKKAVWLAATLTLLYAASDEWHQTFVFGREGSPRDVAIDLIGIMIAVIFILKYNRWKKKRK